MSRLERHSVWLVIAVRAPSLVVCIAYTACGDVIHQRAAEQRLGISPLWPSHENSQFLRQFSALLVRLDFCIFALLLSSPSLISVSEVGLVPSESPACEAKAETKAAIERFDNYIFPLFPPPPLDWRLCFTLGLFPLLALLSFRPFLWASLRT